MLQILEVGEEQACTCDLEECLCQDSADFITERGQALCGCCLGDCPDVHPERYARLRDAMEEALEADQAGREMASEGGRVRPEDDERVQVVQLRLAP